ncbi:ParA family protein [Hamadaea tsunoensis]|uniref:ParA family protein n=1 Tax=Hamadaea tsunoensis TaxID=53368 RepID=UPI00041E6D8D|nr:AAA family ATPase [Hamadaea tsunoensis]
MSVVSVLNYKGGVGKTTLTANLGADLANRGQKVLLIDLDPQSSLTFTFYSADEWARDLAPSRTIRHWYDSFTWAYQMKELFPLVTTPPTINKLVQANGGRLDLIASDLALVDVELDLAAILGGNRHQVMHPDYVKLYRLLANALAADEFRQYDVILIDCPPNFNMVTRTAVVASDYLVVPAKPDYLSTLGIRYLRERLGKLTNEYNGVTGAEWINPVIVGVVFTMVQYAGADLLVKLRQYIAQLKEIEVPTFDAMLRESKAVFANSGDGGVPAALHSGLPANVAYDLYQLTSEFIAKTRI